MTISHTESALRGSATVVFDSLRRERVLLVRHTYGRRNWELPGGGAEPGEDAWTTVARELLEETGLLLRPETLIGIYFEPRHDRGPFVHVSFCLIGTEGQVARPTSPEVDRAAFWPIDRLPRPMSDFTERRIRDAAAGGLVVDVVNGRRWLSGDQDDPSTA